MKDDKSQYVGRYFSKPDLSWWGVRREWKHKVMLERHGSRGSGGQITILKSELGSPEWREHKLPKYINVGDELMYDGEKYKVSSLQQMGGVAFVGITGLWGFSGDHQHENLIPFGSERYLLAEGLRLPFDDELKIRTTTNPPAP